MEIIKIKLSFIMYYNKASVCKRKRYSRIIIMTLKCVCVCQKLKVPYKAQRAQIKSR
jgi:hypothetical protein